MTTTDAIGVHLGEIIAEKYRVERVLGQGGMAVVVAAEHLQLGQRVAIKFLRTSALANAEAVARFEREAQAAFRIHSDHVARVMDVGKLPNGAPYMVIEFLEGHDLGKELAKRGMLAVQDAVAYVLQACDAIGEAHSIGIVHRDLKPANLFLAQRPNRSAVVKVLDFGISKAVNMGAARISALTDAAAVMGSPLYMSPEQLRASRDVDARADIWALGVTLYQLLTGVTPFNAETVAMVCVSILSTEPDPIRARRNDVPPALEAIVMRCLAKDRANRFGSIAELTQALQPYATGVWPSQPPRPLIPSSVPPSLAPSRSVRAAGIAAESRVSPRVDGSSLVIALVFVASVLVALVAGVTGIFYLRKTSAPNRVAPSATSASPSR